MEHDDELRIREKIRNLEYAPLSWDKKLVWTSIRFHGTRPSRRIYVYYAAASLVLATALIIYSLELTYRQKLQARISEIDLALVKSRSMTQESQTHQGLRVVECPQVKPVAGQKPKLAQTVKLTPKADAADLLVESAEIAPTTEPAVALTQQQEKVLEPIIEQPMGRPVEQLSPVIIGRSLSQSPDQASARKGRLQVRIFRGEDETTTIPASTPITTLASINNR